MCHCSVHYLNFFFFARKVYRQYRLAFPISISDSFGNTNFSFQTLIEGVTRRNTCYIIRIIVRFLSKKDSGSKNKTLILFKESSTRLLPLNTNHYIYEPMQESLFMQTIDDRRNASLKSLSPLSSYYYHPPTNASAKSYSSRCVKPATILKIMLLSREKSNWRTIFWSTFRQPSADILNELE